MQPGTVILCCFFKQRVTYVGMKNLNQRVKMVPEGSEVKEVSSVTEKILKGMKNK